MSQGTATLCQNLALLKNQGVLGVGWGGGESEKGRGGIGCLLDPYPPLVPCQQEALPKNSLGRPPPLWQTLSPFSSSAHAGTRFPEPSAERHRGRVEGISLGNPVILPLPRPQQEPTTTKEEGRKLDGYGKKWDLEDCGSFPSSFASASASASPSCTERKQSSVAESASSPHQSRPGDAEVELGSEVEAETGIPRSPPFSMRANPSSQGAPIITAGAYLESSRG